MLKRGSSVAVAFAVVTMATLSVALAQQAPAPKGDVSDVGDASAGRVLAETHCARCHRLDAADTRLSASAPSFVDVARTSTTTALSLGVFLRSPHSDMPNIMLEPAEIRNVSAYILSLK